MENDTLHISNPNIKNNHNNNHKPKHRSQYSFLNVTIPIYAGSTVLLYVVYFSLFFGIYTFNADYVRYLSIFVHTIICVFLIVRFNPLQTNIVFQPHDAKIIFASAMLLLTNIVATEIGLGTFTKRMIDQFKPTKNWGMRSIPNSSWSVTDKEMNPSTEGADSNLRWFNPLKDNDNDRDHDKVAYKYTPPFAIPTNVITSSTGGLSDGWSRIVKSFFSFQRIT